MNKPTMTEELARAASWDAGNRSMRAAGRTIWSPEDADAAWAEFNRLHPENTVSAPYPDGAVYLVLRDDPLYRNASGTQGTLGYVDPRQPGSFWPVAGYHDWKNGSLAFDPRIDKTRPATLEDFRAFRVQPPEGRFQR